MTLRYNTAFGMSVVFATGLLTYYSASQIGLLNNDWYYLAQVARFNLPDYLVQYFDPRLQTGWYRPIFGMLYLVVYSIFGPDPAAHHLAHIVLHASVGALLFVITKHLSQNIRISVIAGLVYVGLAVYSKAVYWPSVPDPLSMFIYLLGVWFWIIYLETAKNRYAVGAFAMFVLDVMTKETSVTLPIILFLVDRLLICRKATLRDLARRYAPFMAALAFYLLIEYAIQHNGSYVSMANYGVGTHMIRNLIDGMALVAFPWDLGAPVKYFWLAIAAAAFLAAARVSRSRQLVFLGLYALINLLPVIAFPPEWFEPRYLYISTMVSAILFGYVCEAIWVGLGRPRWLGALASGVIVLVLFVNYVGVNDAVASWGDIARLRRVPFRDISQKHPTFPPDTYLYFLDSPTVPLADLSDMFLLRYGKGVTVEGADENKIARVGEHAVSYIYYFDPSGSPIELPADANGQLPTSLSLPVDFQAPIRLDGELLAQSSIKRDGTLVLLLYWRALGKIEKDYTVFVHLVDESGQIVAGYDSQPKQGTLVTSSWQPNQLIVDPIVMPIASDVPAGSNYHLELGLYYLPTMDRLGMVDAGGKVISDTLVIDPLGVVE